MEQRLERVRDPNGRPTPGLYRRVYGTATGGTSVLYYGRLKRKIDGKRMLFALGPNLQEAKDEWSIIRVRNRRGEGLSEYKPKKAECAEPRAGIFTWGEWSEKYPLQEGVKHKNSLDTDVGIINMHLKPFFGQVPLTGFTREMLIRYIEKRMSETVIRNNKPSKKSVERGAVSNELSVLRRTLTIAKREELQVVIPSFEGLIVRTKRGGRALDHDERKKVLELYPKWLKRLAEFATETCLSEGDLLRLTEQMIDRKNRVIVPDGGRLKTQKTADEQPRQMAPLTDRCLELLDEILAEKRRSKVAALEIFTREDGRKISRDMISRAVKRAWRVAEVEKFVFHNYRNTALTDWVDRGINVDAAMQASGHTSVQMHKRYLDLRQHHIAKAFGLGNKLVDRDGAHSSSEEKRSGSK